MNLPLYLFLAFLPSLAAKIPWPTASYTHYSHGEDLASLLNGFFASQGINSVIGSGVQGALSGNFIHQDPKTFFEGMAQANSLVWFYDGNHMYIDDSAQVSTQTVQIPYVTETQLRYYIEGLGYETSKSSITAISEAGLIQISGPVKFVQEVIVLAQKLSMGLADKDIFRSFPLKYAWAQDTSVGYQGGQLTVPGVASQLQSLMFQSNGGKLTGTDVATFGGTMGVPQRATSLTPNNNTNPSSAKSSNKSDNKAEAMGQLASPNASIQADVAHNAVTIRDSAGRMPLYEEAIAMLDRPVSIVEITVSIVDVGTQFTSELGNRLFSLEKSIDGNAIWGVNAGLSGTQFNDTTGGLTNNPANIGVTGAFKGTVSAYKFAEAIKALESNNQAQTLSRPSVLTLDNTEAIIDRQQTFYVTTSGQYSTDLFNVNAGTVLRVTPHLIQERGKNKVKLLVNIQDGSIDYDTQVNAIPTVSQSSVTTQAIVAEGEGLLIAGQYNKSDKKGSSGIPFLSRIPLIGALFGTKTRGYSTAERMYLITPKVIDIDQHPVEQHKKYFESPAQLEEGPFESTSTSYATLSPQNSAIVSE